MSPILLTIVGLLYIASAIDMFYHGRNGLGVALICWAIANFGLLWDAVR